MKLLKIACIFLWLGLSIKTSAQKIDTARFEQLSNKHYLPYKNKQGEYLGCANRYECMGMTIVFYEIVLDKKQRMLTLKGRAVESRDIGDSNGVYGAAIYLAKPDGEKLAQVRDLGITFVDPKKPKDKSAFPLRHGDFSIRFRFQNGDRLYFEDPLFWPLEYNISKLL